MHRRVLTLNSVSFSDSAISVDTPAPSEWPVMVRLLAFFLSSGCTAPSTEGSSLLVAHVKPWWVGTPSSLVVVCAGWREGGSG